MTAASFAGFAASAAIPLDGSRQRTETANTIDRSVFTV
jgi:hypothetical protein